MIFLPHLHILFNMVDIPVSTILNYFLFLLFPFLFGLGAKKLKISPIVGYIIGGLFLGNFFEGFFSKEVINHFAYFGIIILLFTIGLEMNFARILAVKKFIIFGGTLQIICSIIFIWIVSLFFKFTLLQSFLIGIALSSSSTTLVAKIIQDRGEENSFIGEIALGILMFQDIAFIPFLILFSSITSQSTSFSQVALKILVSVITSICILLVLFYIGKSVIPRMLDRVARVSRELLNVFLIVFIFFITFLSLALHIPILIGVFVAGILVAQSVEHQHIFCEMRPFRDVLAVVFFVFIGMNIKIPLIQTVIPSIFLFTFLVIFGKALIILLIFLCFRFHSKTSFSLATYLFQIDEDAFILMSVMVANKVISPEGYLFIITSVLISLVITPLWIQHKDGSYVFIRNMIKKTLPFLDRFISHSLDRDSSPIDVLNIKNHIVICGYGRIGSHIGRVLLISNIPFVAIDYNFHTVEKAKKEGVNIIYGDPSDVDILDYAQVEDARVLIMAVPDRNAQEMIILNAKKLNPNIFTISRVHKKLDHLRMRDLGVDMLIQPEIEASVSIIKKVLLLYHVPKEEIIGRIRGLKLEHGLV